MRGEGIWLWGGLLIAALLVGALVLTIGGSPLRLDQTNGETIELPSLLTGRDAGSGTEDRVVDGSIPGTPRTFRIVTILPQDAIPAILSPSFLTRAEGDVQLEPDELVLGLSLNGDHRAYSIPLLSSHEIVNDVVGGVPVAVTW